MQIHQAKSIREFVEVCCRNSGTQNLITVYERVAESQNFVYNSLTGRELESRVVELSQLHQVSGLDGSARVAVMGETSVDWIVNFFAALLNGATVFPVDIKLSSSEVAALLDHFQPTHIVVSDTLWGIAENLPMVIDNRVKLIRFSDFYKFPRGWVSKIATDHKQSNTPSLVIYTSGTSAQPKGAVIDLSSVFFEAAVSAVIFPPDPSMRVVFSILPLNHIYGLVIGLFVNMWAGNEVCLSQSIEPKVIQKIMRERTVNKFAAVPLLLSLIKNAVEEKVRSQSLLKRIIFNMAIAVNSKLRLKSVSNLVFKPIRDQFGTQFQFFLTGGAPIEDETIDFFEAVGWPVYNGYGLTETGPAISTNTKAHRRKGTVGKPFPGVEVKIVNGEICTKGQHLFKGYYNSVELTRQAFTEDGWFRTGDTGYVDQDGYLVVLGRLKNMIVLPSGKKIQPEEVEEKLMLSKFVKFACLVAVKGKGFNEKLIAVIQVHDAYFAWLSDQNQLSEITDELKKVSQVLATYKQPHEYFYRKQPFEITSSQKVRRHVVQREIEATIQ